MYRFITMIAVFIVVSISFPKLLIAEDTFPKDWCDYQDYKCLVQRYSKEYTVSAEDILKVLKCESNFRTNVYGDGGKAFGIAQFHEPTFNAFSKDLGEQLDYHSYQDQIKLISWAFAHNKKNHWTCSSITRVI